MKKVFTLTLMLAAMFMGSTRVTTGAAKNQTTETSIATGSYRLEANSYHRHQIFLTRGITHITVSGDGDTDLDVYIYDEAGNQVAIADGSSDDEFIGLTVYRGGYFNIKVVNRGNVYNDYTFVVQ